MNFKDYLQLHVKEINPELDEIFDKWQSEIEKLSPLLLPIARLLAESTQGGKRLRGALIKLGYELASPEYNPDILKVAAAFEIFQTAILTHDDVIDQSPLRRGKPTVFKALGGDHYGLSQAITLGDIGFFLAVRLMSESIFLDRYKSKAITLFAQTMLDTAVGEMLDIELPHLKTEKKETDVIAIYKLKTGRYTFIGPLQVGAVLGGGGEQLLHTFGLFGEDLGVAFQIQDDILGVFGDEEMLGKPVTSDVEEGKETLLITQALIKASSEQRQVLDKYYGRGQITPEGLDQIRRVFIDTGAVDYAAKLALEYAKSAKSYISSITEDENQQNLLSSLADFLVRREK